MHTSRETCPTSEECIPLLFHYQYAQLRVKAHYPQAHVPCIEVQPGRKAHESHILRCNVKNVLLNRAQNHALE